MLLPFFSFTHLYELLKGKSAAIIYYLIQFIFCFSFVLIRKTEWYHWLVSQLLAFLIIVLIFGTEQLVSLDLLAVEQDVFGLFEVGVISFCNTCIQGIAAILAIVTRSMKKPRYKIILLIVIIFAVLSFVAGLVIYKRLYDSSKPNIFEIPGTAIVWSSDNINKIQSLYFFIQKPPQKREELEKLINSYVFQNNIMKKYLSECIDVLEIKFYKPSFSLPIFFEQNNSFWFVDDYIDHYKDEITVKAYYKHEGDPEFVYEK